MNTFPILQIRVSECLSVFPYSDDNFSFYTYN